MSRRLIVMRHAKSSWDSAFSIAVDSLDNVIVAGTTHSGNFLTEFGPPMSNHRPEDKYVVSSLVVQARRADSAEVEAAILSMDGASIAEKIDNKFAVVLETESTDSAAGLTERIRAIDGVTGVELVAHFFEEEVLDDTNESD